VPLDPKRKGDVKVIVGATIAVLLVGFFIFGAMMMTTGGRSGPTCAGQLNIGLATGVRTNLEHGPYFQTGGGRCGFFLALENDNIVAYRVEQPSGCTALWKFDHWECDGRTISAARLAKFPVSIRTGTDGDSVVVNLGSPVPSSTTTAAPSTNVTSTAVTSTTVTGPAR
jgi:hypothetical protein